MSFFLRENAEKRHLVANPVRVSYFGRTSQKAENYPLTYPLTS